MRAQTIRCVVAVSALIAWTVVMVPLQGDVDSTRDWPAVGGAWGNMHYSPLTQITAANVKEVGGAWKSEPLANAASSRAMPVVKDGVMYLTAPPSVYALNAKTGATIWRYDSGGGRQGGPGQGAPAREGVAVADGMVFFGLSNARAVALDVKTGKKIWDQYLGDNPRDKGQVISGAPLYAAGLVTFGLSADNGWRGQIVALDPKTGREVWRFYAIPRPGDPGHDTWPSAGNSWQRGGAAIWLAGTADPDLGIVYYVTGNGVPQLGGEGRAGDNLYLCSVIALDARTGKLKWHYQVMRHDIWEGDISISPVLSEVTLDGGARKAIGAMRADGYLFLLDRATGKPLSKIEERPVPQDALQKTSPTQPFPVGADRVLPDCDEWRKASIPKGFVVGCFFTPASVHKPNLLAPSYGMRVAPMAFSPQTNYFYATGDAGLSWQRRAEDPFFFDTFNDRVPGIRRLNFGVVAAIDARTNKIAWKKEFRSGRPSGALVTAGGLMLQSTPDRQIEAYDARTGQLLWQSSVGASGGPPVSFDIDGEQYIATIAGNSVWAFKLHGSLPQAAGPNATAARDEAFVGPIATTTQIETASLAKDRGFTGTHYFTDEFAFAPYRTRVPVGTQVMWRNNGRMVHTIVAEDGSWTTGPLNEGDVGATTFTKPGTYVYICKEHPWAYGQVIVE
jgi:glucose dehydrogenase/plastocyanin